MGYAPYVGRVGALAVALGIGAAVANGPAVAWAHDDGEGSSSSSSSSSSSGSSDASGGSAGADGAAGTDGADGDDGDDGTAGEDGVAGEDEAAGAEEPGESGEESGEESAEESRSGSERPSVERKSAGGSRRQTPSQRAEVTARVSAHVDASVTSSSGARSGSDPDIADVADSVQPKAGGSQAPLSVSMSASVSRSVVSDVAAASTIPPAPAPMQTVTTAVLSWLGLSPFASGGPTDGPDSPIGWAVFAALRRQAEEDTVGEQRLMSVADPMAATLSVENAEPMMMMAAAAAPSEPTVNTPDHVSGVVTGVLNAGDLDGNSSTTSTYTVVGTPANGSVTVDGSGNFSYKPTQLARMAADQTSGTDYDSFTVSVTDGQASTTVNVTVTISSARLEAGTPVTVGRDPTGVAIKGTKAFVANKYDKSVSVVDTNTGAVLATIKVAGSPTAIAVSPVANDNRAYVAMSGTNSVAVIDTVNYKVIDVNPATSTVVDNIKVGSGPSAILVSPDGKRVYVSNGSSTTVSAIDTVTYKEVAKLTVGSAPTGLAVSPDNSRLYALGSSGDKLTVFNTTTGAVLGSLNVGDSPRGIVLSADGKRAYVSNYNADTVAVVDTSLAIPKLVTSIKVGDKPEGIALSGDGKLVYVANGPDTVSVINTATNTVVGSPVVIDTTVANAAHGIAFTADGKAYVTDFADDVVRVVALKHYNAAPLSTRAPELQAPDPATGAVNGIFNVEDPDKDPLSYTTVTAPTKGSVTYNVATDSFTYTPTQAARDAAVQTPANDTFTVRIADNAGAFKNVTVTVTISPTVGQTAISVGQLPTDVAISGNRAYVANWYDGTVSVINTSTNTVTQTLTVGPRPTSIASSPDGSHMYVANAGNNTVSVINTNSQTVVANVVVPIAQDEPGVFHSLVDLQVSPDNKKVYVTATDGTVSVIDTTTRVVSGPYTVGPAASGIAVSPDGSRLYVSTELWNSNVIVVDANSMTVIENIDIGESYFPIDGSFTPDGKRLYLITGAQGSETAEPALMVIDTDPTSATYNTVIRTLSAYELGTWHLADVILSPDGNTAYVSDAGGNKISVIDTRTTSVIGTITTGPPSPSGSRGLAISPDGETLYITDQASNEVRVVAADSAIAV